MNSIIFDLDDTLYDYNRAHAPALKNALNHFSLEFQMGPEEVNSIFQKARKTTHFELNGVAASHNRLLYFQKMLEAIGRNSLEYGLDIYNSYWDCFLSNMVLSDGVIPLLKKEKKKGTKVCILTDLTAHIQFRKLKKLNLHHYFDLLVTSEEVGHEKPHSCMFNKALEKLKSLPDETIMIGDNWDKDIKGAQSVDIKSIWLNRRNVKKPLSDSIQEVQSFSQIHNILDQWN